MIAANASPNRARSYVVPKVSRGWLRLFSGYNRWYLRRNFHSVRLATASHALPATDLPLVIYVNHASWWDPLICLALAREFFPQRTGFAPIDAQMLRRYGFFSKLGFFGVEQNTRRGAAQFLRTSQAVLQAPGTMLWLTPQGRFADVRERPVRFQSGLGHLAMRLPRAVFIPLALEICFWEERTPEVLAQFGEPVLIGSLLQEIMDPDKCTRLFEQKMTAAVAQLSGAVQRRNPKEFHTLWRGQAGVGGGYDVWRSWRARWRGETFNPEHGVK